MSQSPEPSYYEVALTNRQVVTAFVILLTCLLAAFFSGVWVGRGGSEPVGQQVVATPPEEATVATGTTPEPLDFFEDVTSGNDGKGGTANGKSAPSALPTKPPVEVRSAEVPTTLASPPEPEQVAATEVAKAKPSTTSATEAKKPEAKKGDAEKKSADKSGSKSATPETTRPADRAREEATQTERPKVSGGDPVPEGGTFFVQVFASSDRTEATKVRDKLSSGGHKAYLSPTKVGGKTLYRVRVGSFKTRDRAQKVADRIRRGYRLDTWVTQ